MLAAKSAVGTYVAVTTYEPGGKVVVTLATPLIKAIAVPPPPRIILEDHRAGGNAVATLLAGVTVAVNVTWLVVGSAGLAEETQRDPSCRSG